MWLLSPIAIRAIAAAAILAGLAWAYHLWADHQRDIGRAEIRAEWNVAKIEQADAQRETEMFRRKAATSAATGHEDDKVRIVTKYKTITQEVERVVNQIEYRDRACLTDDGLRVLNQAIAASAGSAGNTAITGDTLPKPAASE